MEPWCKSDITLQCLEGLIRRDLLCSWTAAEEWRLLGDEDMPSPLDRYIVSFAHFHERGFASPAHKFLQGLLHYYKVELQHLTPNGVQHIAAFAALCEGFLGISPHFDLWQYFFVVNLLKKQEKRQELSMPMECFGIHLSNSRVNEYPSMHLSTSNKGWHSHWFYLKDAAAAPLPEFIGRLIEEAPYLWKWGVPEKDKKKI